MDGDPPPQVLSDASLTILPGQIRPRQGRAIVVAWQGTQPGFAGALGRTV